MNNQIFLDYSSNPINPDEFDSITFTLVDKYTNISSPDSVIVPCRIGNYSKSNDAYDYDTALGLKRNIDFIPQETRVYSLQSEQVQILLF